MKSELQPDPARSPDAHAVIEETQTWLDKAVIGLNLCPFAKGVRTRQAIRFVCSIARNTDDLRIHLIEELRLLVATDPRQIETSLLIHPDVLNDFFDYNDFLDVADLCLEELELVGEIQIASFHPDYCFAGSDAAAIENNSNRSPYPLLHLLRESSIDQALAGAADAEQIVERNIETLRRLGPQGWRSLFER